MLWLISPHPASCPKILGGQGCNYSRATWPESSISESSLCVTGKITRGAGRVAPLEQFAWAVFTPPDRSGPSRWPGSGWGGRFGVGRSVGTRGSLGACTPQGSAAVHAAIPAGPRGRTHRVELLRHRGRARLLRRQLTRQRPKSPLDRSPLTHPPRTHRPPPGTAGCTSSATVDPA